MSEYKIIVVNNSSKPGTYVVFQAPPSGVVAPTNWSVRETIEAGGSAEVSFTPPPPKPVGLFAKLRALLFGAPPHATPDHFHLAVEAEGEVGPYIDFSANATVSTKIVHGLDGALSVAAVSTLGYSVFNTPEEYVAPVAQGDNFIAAYSIMAIFTNSAGPSCANGEYHQMVKGMFSVDGSVISHILCGSTVLSPTVWQEDGCPPGTCTAYGYRACPPSASNAYTNPDQATGSQYAAYDQPGFHNIHPGYTYTIGLQFQGQLIDTAVGVTLATRSWSVEGQFAAPTVALVDAPQGLQPSDRLVGAHLSRNLANNGPEVHVLIARVHGSPRLDPNAVKVALVDAEGQPVSAAEPVTHEVGGQRGTTATIVHRLLRGQATPVKATIDIDGQVIEAALAVPAAALDAPYQQAPLPGCATIDSSLNPYLDNARAGNPTAGASNSTQTAVSNLLTCARQSGAARQASLIGQGAEGVSISTRRPARSSASRTRRRGRRSFSGSRGRSPSSRSTAPAWAPGKTARSFSTTSPRPSTRRSTRRPA